MSRLTTIALPAGVALLALYAQMRDPNHAPRTSACAGALDIALRNNLGIRVARNNVDIATINNSYGIAGGLPLVNITGFGYRANRGYPPEILRPPPTTPPVTGQPPTAFPAA